MESDRNDWLEPCVDLDGALHRAAAEGDVLNAEALIAERPTRSVNDLDERGKSPLYVACWHGRAAMAKWLLDRGADPNAVTAGNQSSALHAVAYRSPVHGCALVPLLLLCGANVDAVSSNGYTALHAAAFVGNDEAVRLLLLAGADPTLRSVSKLAPKDVAPLRDLAQLLAKAERELDPRTGRKRSSQRHSMGQMDVVAALVAPRLAAACEVRFISERVTATRTRVPRDRSVSTPFLYETCASTGVRRFWGATRPDDGRRGP